MLRSRQAGRQGVVSFCGQALPSLSQATFVAGGELLADLVNATIWDAAEPRGGGAALNGVMGGFRQGSVASCQRKSCMSRSLRASPP